MKKSIYLLALFGLSLSVVACEKTDASDSNVSTSVDVSNSVTESTTPSVSDSSPTEDEYNQLPNWDTVSYEFSSGGDLLDIAVGRAFMTGGEYLISYTMNSTLPSVSSGERAVSSNEKVFTLEKDGTGFKLTCHHAGQAYLRIYDSNNIIRYCQLVTVKDAIPLSYMEEYLVYDCEYWVSRYSWSDSFVITFNEGGQYTVSGMLSAVEFEPITGTYEYVETLNNGKEYSYRFTDTDVASIGLVGFHIATTGTFMYLQDNYGTAALMFPADTATIN